MYSANNPRNGSSNGGFNDYDFINVETVVKEPKKGIVNSSAEDEILVEEFLPLVEPGLREDVTACSIGRGHFNLGRKPVIKGE